MISCIFRCDYARIPGLMPAARPKPIQREASPATYAGWKRSSEWLVSRDRTLHCWAYRCSATHSLLLER